MPDASLYTMTRIRTTLYNQRIRAADYRAVKHVPRGLTLATIGANDLGNEKILEQDSYIIPDSPFRRPPKLVFPGPSILYKNSSTILYFNNIGGPATFYEALSLPAGLSINENTGIITGAPTVLSDYTQYSIKSSNDFGYDILNFELSVFSGPPNILYSGSPFTFTQGANITPITVTNTGDTTDVIYTGNLPNGLTLAPINGTIYGTPTIENITVPSVTSYDITATNISGSSRTSIIVNMNPAAPTFSYPPGTYNIGVDYFHVIIGKRPMTPIAPINAFTPITFSIQAAYPTGTVTVNTTTGVIQGTPSGGYGTASYFIRGQNTTGTKTEFIQFLIDSCPPVFSYSPNIYTFTQNIPISDINIVQDYTVSDGFLNSIISPSLPAGLSFNPATAKISGTPLAVSSTQTYTVTAYGMQRYSPIINGTTTITITVNPP